MKKIIGVPMMYGKTIKMQQLYENEKAKGKQVKIAKLEDKEKLLGMYKL